MKIANEDGKVTLLAGDIEIGAVEVKNSIDDTRATVGANGLHVDVKAQVALPAGTNNIGDVDVATINSVAPQFDDTDKLAVSLYAKGTLAGDTALERASLGTYNLLLVTLGGGSGGIDIRSGNAISSGLADAYGPIVYPYLYNGSSADKFYNNIEAVLLASAARTATLQSADQVNYNGSGLIVIVNVSSITATPILTPYLQIKDSISGVYFTIWTAAATITTATTVAYLFAPGGAAGSYTEAVNLRLARTWRLGVTHADTDSATYSVSAVVLV